ncbi:sucrase ferredoxin [Ornithinimicrobium tianjinense]|uniref:Sucrase ferredoxin n=1 Tax=Ornithinimicrobium tianjinense TaxID=1195761 RepID=A0A917BG22_9MICO|nr:sucrase ferredoxin [Ornithinimicrobium tianjinense]GGF42589.1 sucrase ferredoxin [Ornithinimicrobium tianjinense]
MSETLSAVPCSDAARERQDPMLGTAPPQARFLLVEVEGGWRFGGFADLVLQQDVKDEVVARAEAVGARVMLIRRPGRQTSSVCYLRAWCAVDLTATPGSRVTWGTWAYPSELLSGIERLEELASGAGTADPLAEAASRDAADLEEPARTSDDVLILVCTHGKKDPCCAVRGRPVAQALARRWPEQTWECSHTGGDRFAANVLLLPDGATYGGLDPDTALEAVEGHLQGAPATAHLRGLAGQPRPVQAAMVAAHDELGPLAWGDLTPVVISPREPEGSDVAAWTVTLAVADGRRAEVDVTEHRRPAAQLTCRTADAKVSQVPVAGPVRLV